MVNCYLGGERHKCECVSYGHGLSETFVRTCDECKERGCDERRRRRTYASQVRPGLGVYRREA